MIATEAWVLYQGDENTQGNGQAKVAELTREVFWFADLADDEVLVEPLYCCWEANMTHALERRPVDICRQRKEEKIVLGNGGVARVLRAGPSVTSVNEGDLCIVTGNRVWDKRGYMIKAYGYDAPDTVGLLAKQTKVHELQLIRVPENTKYSLAQWAAFSIRYVTAWANWRQAYGCLRLQIGKEEFPDPFVWGWGGGVSLAELALARMDGCRTAMLASGEERLRTISASGAEAIDRSQFRDLSFDQQRYNDDPKYRSSYKESEDSFLQTVRRKTDGSFVSIFIDNIGTPVVRATLKALACPGVITTAGWKLGMSINLIRALECMKWHTHVHTHYARYSDAVASVEFAEKTGWMPPQNGSAYQWDDVPGLARDYADGRERDYFPLVRINRI